MKLWQKATTVDSLVESFTIGQDKVFDLYLSKADILGSLAHTQMLQTIGLMTEEELTEVTKGLKQIYKKVEEGSFTIDEGVEDIHSQVEFELTQKIGPTGGKIHSGRSRNDQVLVDLKIFIRSQIHEIVSLTEDLFKTLISLSERHKDILMPGYTHLQVAMPSSFGLWFGAYAESLVDDLEMVLASYKVCNKNPLGSAAGYGSSFPLDRELTTKLLGFDNLNYNVVYAQMGRGKCEKILAMALSNIASTLSRFAMDNCMFMSQNFGFVKYPDEFTTGSSIMPHKKNPDVWELVRGKCNIIQATPNTIAMLTANLPLGYNRDLQLIKEVVFPAIEEMKNVLNMANVMVQQIIVNREAIFDKKYDPIFSVERVNDLVLKEGQPFREAYKRVGMEIETGDFTPQYGVDHTHEGSIGNLCNKHIEEMFTRVVSEFNFERYTSAEKELIKD